MPAGHVPQQPLEEDEIIQAGRKRPLGRNEYDFLYRGEMPPPNTQLGIHVMNAPNVFNTLQEYVDYMNSESDEDHQIEVASVTGTPIIGGRKTKRKTIKRKTKHGGRSRKARRTKHRR